MNKLKTYNNFINEGVRDMMTPKSNVDEIADNLFLHKYPDVGTFDYKKYGFTINYDNSTFDRPHGVSDIHIVFNDEDGNEWVMFITDGETHYPRIQFMGGNKNKINHINYHFNRFL